jgi:uncharacterized membrane protein YfcA
MSYTEISWIALAFLFGGALKGIIGVGAPVVAIPILTIFFDIQTAVATMVIPNLITNLWQAFRYRQHINSKKFVSKFAISGAIGAGAGTALLISLSAAPLLLGLAGIIFIFLLFRILKAEWQLSSTATNFLVIPCGLTGGALQGAAGLSAPVSVTFLNAVKLERRNFIPIISIYFVFMSVVQIPILYTVRLLDTGIMIYSTLVLPIIFAGMLIGSYASKHINAKTFEKIILGTLLVMALRLTYRAVTGS